MIVRVNPSGATRETLQRRASFGGRKGRAARRRLARRTVLRTYDATSLRIFLGDIEITGRFADGEYVRLEKHA